MVRVASNAPLIPGWPHVYAWVGGVLGACVIVAWVVIAATEITAVALFAGAFGVIGGILAAVMVILALTYVVS